MSVYDKLWNLHSVVVQTSGATLLYIGVHLIHEVTSPYAFHQLKQMNVVLHKPEHTLGIADHNVSTDFYRSTACDYGLQVWNLACNAYVNHIECLEPSNSKQGIVHVVGPELGVSRPGRSVVCGDSHTSSHGALTSLAQGIGTSELTNVLASGCIVQHKLRSLVISAFGLLPNNCHSKDVILALLRLVGTSGGTGFAVEFDSCLVKTMSISSRMTLCNMSIELGAKFGLTSTDNTTLNYLMGRSYDFDSASRLKTTGATTATKPHVFINLSSMKPQITWGTSPEMVVAVTEKIPHPKAFAKLNQQQSCAAALNYMGLEPNMRLQDVPVDYVFIGSCTNSRIEDLRAVANVIQLTQLKVHNRVRSAVIVPGSGTVKAQAELEGLHHVFRTAGFEWKTPGCSMCIAMNLDRLLPFERCVSTSNRNFEGRQGFRSRTHLASPTTATLSALKGRISCF